MRLQDRARGALLGLAVGDAVGTTVEFRERGSFEPVTDMVGGGPFSLPAGAWTDDTSMALCLAESLVGCGGFDARDQMKRYVRWWREGHWSSTGTCFDIGLTIRDALSRFEEQGEPFSGSRDPCSAGNGCLMRLAPIPIFWHDQLDATLHHAAESARTTHGADECLDASRLLAEILHRGLGGASREEMLAPPFHAAIGTTPAVAAIAAGEWRGKAEPEIRSDGYVIHTLEAALWCFARADGFEQAVLCATNLGEDADTTAAVAGQLAGACFGERGIPALWRERLLRGDEIAALADALRVRGARAASEAGAGR